MVGKPRPVGAFQCDRNMRNERLCRIFSSARYRISGDQLSSLYNDHELPAGVATEYSNPVHSIRYAVNFTPILIDLESGANGARRVEQDAHFYGYCCVIFHQDIAHGIGRHQRSSFQLHHCSAGGATGPKR